MTQKKTMLKKSKTILVIVVFILLAVGMVIVYLSSKKNNAEQSAPVVLVVTSPVSHISMSKTLTAYGTITFDPKRTHHLTIQNQAIVQQVFVSQGQQVKKDDPLMKLSPTADISLNLENAKIVVEFAQKELNRTQILRNQYLATNSEVQAASQNLAKAEAVLNNILTQQKNETGTVLRATCDCTVIAINVQPGQTAMPATPLLSYGEQEQVQVHLGIESEDRSQIHVGQQVIITPVNGTFQKPLISYIHRVTEQTIPNTNLIDVIIPIQNTIGLIPGTMVRGEIVLVPKVDRFVVPRSAILYQKNQAYVFINDHGKALKRWVTVAEDNGKFVAILTGLKGDENVVTIGNYELQNGMLLQVEHKQ